MTTPSKILSIVAATGMTAGLYLDYHGVGDHAWLAATLPLGTIAFVVSFVMYMLETEIAKFDEEQAAKLKNLQPLPATSAPVPDRQTSARPIQLKHKTV